jgi:hypothetical protein
MEKFVGNVFLVEPCSAPFIELTEVDFVFVQGGLADGELGEVHV